MPSNSPQTPVINISEGDLNSVSEVVVFTNQAYITRAASTSVDSGLQSIRVEVQAFSLDQESAQAVVHGKGDLLSVQYQQIPVEHAPQEELRELDDQRRELQYQLTRLDGSAIVVEKQRGFLDSVVNFSGTEIPKKLKTTTPKPESLKEVLAFIGNEFSDLENQDASLKKERDKLDQQLSVIEQKIKGLRRGNSSKLQVIEILFESAEKQRLDLQVSYLANYASWTPVYRADVPDSLDGLKLTTMAKIQQRTGEDWLNCKLSVSSSTPSHGGEIPEPESWHLYATPAVTGYEESMLLGAAQAEPLAVEEGTAVFEDFGAIEAGGEVGPAEPAEFKQASAQDLPLAIEYELPQPVTVPADGSESLLPLSHNELQSNCFHLVSPRQDPTVYLVCRTELSEELLPGRLNVHFGGRFVHSTRLGESDAGEELLLNLGPDRNVKANRRRISDKLTETLFGKMDRSTLAKEVVYKTLLENRRKENIEVHLLDSIPVSTTDRYAVKGLELKPEPDERDWKDREGVMLWKQSITPGESVEVSMKFQIKYPRDSKPFGV